MYGGNTKYHSNPYIQGTTVPCDVLTYNLALGQETVATRFLIDLGLAELRNVRDSVALGS